MDIPAIISRLFTLTIVITLTASLTSFASQGDDTCGDPCGKPTPWDQFNRFELKVTTPEDSGYSFWKGTFDKKSDDIQVDIEISDGKKITKGKILMVGGRIMVTQGPVTEPGYEIDALDAPILEQKLVFRLLGEALPNGPEELKETRKIDFKSENTGIQFATPSAQGFISAPWRVRGEVKADTPDVVDYQLSLTSPGMGNPVAQPKERNTNFVGRLSKVATARIDDSLSLGAWKVLGVGVQTRKEGDTTMYDYGAAPSSDVYKTVADIRKKLSADDYPGEADPSKNFTGFWKQDCEQAFGLRIMPYGTDGKYSIVFCGPGGCGDPDNSGRVTFITKDRNYEIISESEIKERTSDGWEVYHRCTTDPHPILRYKEELNPSASTSPSEK